MSRWHWIGVYLCLLIGSHIWIATRAAEVLPTPEGSERVSLGIAPNVISALRWKPKLAADLKLPVVLLHGSPGAAADMTDLARRLASDGREVLSLDLPGFAGSEAAPGGRSILDHAHAALAAVPWQEFHVAAWSMGGGVALHMANLAPERVRSLSQIACIGVQEAEGSGSFFFEHVKYALMWTLLVPGAELIPHFGVLGTRSFSNGFCRNFWESDQRPLRRILSTTKTPLFIAHGRKDFLVPLWCAEESHALAADSRLVIFEGSHFLLFEPEFGQLDLLAPELEAFLARHDVNGVVEPRAVLDLSLSKQVSTPIPFWLPRKVPWWISLVLLALLARWRAGCCGLIVGGLAAMLQLDLGLGLIAGALGAVWRVFSTPDGSWKRWLVDLAFLLGGIVLASIVVGWSGKALCDFAGPWGGVLLALALPLIAVLIVVRLLRHFRRTGATT